MLMLIDGLWRKRTSAIQPQKASGVDLLDDGLLFVTSEARTSRLWRDCESAACVCAIVRFNYDQVIVVIIIFMFMIRRCCCLFRGDKYQCRATTMCRVCMLLCLVDIFP